LLVGVIVLVWPADAKQRGEGAETLPDDLRLVPGDTSTFVSVRLAELMNTEAGKKLMPGLRKTYASNVDVLAKTLGVSLAGIERLTIFVSTLMEPVLIVRTAGAYDRERVLGPKATKSEVAGHAFYVRTDGAMAYLADKNTFVLGSPEGVVELVKAGAKKAPGPLTEALKRAAGKHHFVLGLQPELLLRLEFGGRHRKGEKGERPSLEQILDRLPPEILPYRPVLEARSVIVTADAGTEIRVNAELHYAGEEAAREGATAARTALYVARHLLPRFFRDELHLAADATGPVADLSRLMQKSLKAAVVDREKTVVQASLRVKVDAGMLASTVAVLQAQARRQQAMNDLKQLALASINFADSNSGVMMGPAICDKAGKPLLSWRVTILPYVEQAALYTQFKLDEAWDSEHNKKLLAKMPSVYAPKAGKTKEPHSTYYRVFTGPDTLFDFKKVRRGPEGLGGARYPASIPDGTANTIMIVEAAEAVPWTKPDELVYDAKKPLPKLGVVFPESFLVAMCDGSVRMVRKTVSEKTLRAAITPADGEVLGADW
jgi:hypothetical protein